MRSFSLNFDDEMQKALDLVPDDIDKREGSLIYTAVAPTILKICEMAEELNILQRLLYASTASGEYLDKRIEEFGPVRLGATRAVRKLKVTDRDGGPLENLPLGMILWAETLEYVISEELGEGEYLTTVTTPGTEGNKYFGEVVPLEPVNTIGLAEVTTVVIPARDEETDEEYYDRFKSQRGAISFGGNRQYYQTHLLQLDGVGQVKTQRTPEGPKTVGVTILGADTMPASEELIESVQAFLDPPGRSGEGDGLSPIWHYASVDTPTKQQINVEVDVETLSGSLKVKEDIEKAVEDYLETLRKEWQESEQLIVRSSKIMMALLDLEDIVDVRELTINGSPGNTVVRTTSVPVKGEVIVNDSRS